MKDKLYVIIIIALCMIGSGFAIDNVRLENELRDKDNMLGQMAVENIKLYNENDYLKYFCK